MTTTTRFARSALTRAALGISSATMLLGCTLCPCPQLPPPAKQAETTANPAEVAPGDVTSQPYVWKSVAILGGGFVTGVIFSPAEKDLIYARTDIGGAYRFDQANQTWVPITDMLSRDQSNFKGIESLAPDPVDANRVYMAVGTYTQDWAGAGAMMRSTDRGETWEIKEMPIKMGGNENGRGNGERLAVDPNQNDIILFGSRKYGMWKSTDAGASWGEGKFPQKTEPLGVGITFVLFDRGSGTKGKPTPTLYAGWASTEGGLYRSQDAGDSWELVPGQPKGVMPSHGEFDSKGTLYLSYGNKPGPSEVRDGGIWKFNPKSGRWRNISPRIPTPKDQFGYGGLSVMPDRPGTVMVTTLDRWGPGDEIWRTTDGGKKWTAIGAKVVRDHDGAKYLYWGRKEEISATGWMADIALDPFNPSRAMYVTGQGIWATTDGAEADANKPTHWKFLNRGLEETAVKDLASPPAGAPLLSAVGDLGGFRHDDLSQPSAGGMFQNPIFGNGSSIDFAEAKPETVVCAGSHKEGKTGAISADGGTTWTPFATTPQGSKGSGDIVISADGSSIVWAGKDAAPAYSQDRGKTWQVCTGLPKAQELPDWAPVHFRPAADRVSPKKLYIYDAMGGKAYASADGGASFTASEASLPTLPDWGLSSASIRAVPGKEGDVWVTTGKELFHSTDSGVTYDTVRLIEEAYGIGFGKAAEGKDYPAIYLSAKIDSASGYYRSDDGGTNWVRINDDRQRFGGADLIIGDPRVYGRVYVGTHGRGILYGEPK